jgi:hypothetical protein
VVFFCTPSVPIARSTQVGEEFANLSTYRDYNHLAERVNANQLPADAVTSCYCVVFRQRSSFVIISANLCCLKLLPPYSFFAFLGKASHSTVPADLYRYTEVPQLRLIP